MVKKLKQQRGESLVETLVALLIATMSVIMLTSALTASARINRKNRDADEVYARELKRVESYESTAEYPKQDTNITLNFGNGVTLEKVVELYGGTDGKMASYKVKGEGGS